MNAAAPQLNYLLRSIQRFLDDPQCEDIYCNEPGRLLVRRGAVTTPYDVPELDTDTLEDIAILAGALRGQDVGRARPILGTELPGGQRLQVVLPPAVAHGRISLTIRRPNDAAPSLDSLQSGGLFDGTRNGIANLSAADQQLLKLYRAGDWLPFFKLAVQSRKTTVAVGEVGSGKTFTTMAFLDAILPEERVVTIEDTAEWNKLKHPNRVALFYPKGDSNRATECLESALRMGPQWVCLQELRDGASWNFLRALASGHSGITTWHARSATEAFDAVCLMVKQHPAGAAMSDRDIDRRLRSYVDVVVHCVRDGSRYSMSEVWFAAAEIDAGKLAA